MSSNVLWTTLVLLVAVNQGENEDTPILPVAIEHRAREGFARVESFSRVREMIVMQGGDVGVVRTATPRKVAAKGLSTIRGREGGAIRKPAASMVGNDKEDTAYLVVGQAVVAVTANGPHRVVVDFADRIEDRALRCLYVSGDETQLVVEAGRKVYCFESGVITVMEKKSAAPCEWNPDSKTIYMLETRPRGGTWLWKRRFGESGDSARVPGEPSLCKISPNRKKIVLSPALGDGMITILDQTDTSRTWDVGLGALAVWESETCVWFVREDTSLWRCEVGETPARYLSVVGKRIDENAQYSRLPVIAKDGFVAWSWAVKKEEVIRFGSTIMDPTKKEYVVLDRRSPRFGSYWESAVWLRGDQ